MLDKEIYLINDSLPPLLELGEFLSKKDDAFDILVGLIEQFEKSLDPRRVTHSTRVSILAEVMGDALNLSEKEKEHLKKSAQLHDVGKIFLPKELFFKTEKLSAKEWQIVRLHPELGVALIKQIPQLLLTANGILAHHEKFNGTGYPYGLIGKQIPLMGRIIGIVDCFEALTASRTYHSPLSVKQALEKMEKQKEQGIWDPFLFDVFAEIVSSADFVSEEKISDLNLIFKN